MWKILKKVARGFYELPSTVAVFISSALLGIANFGKKGEIEDIDKGLLSWIAVGGALFSKFLKDNAKTINIVWWITVAAFAITAIALAIVSGVAPFALAGFLNLSLLGSTLGGFFGGASVAAQICTVAAIAAIATHVAAYVTAFIVNAGIGIYEACKSEEYSLVADSSEEEPVANPKERVVSTKKVVEISTANANNSNKEPKYYRNSLSLSGSSSSQEESRKSIDETKHCSTIRY